MPEIQPLNIPVDVTIFGALLAFWLGLFWYHPKVMGQKWIEARKIDGIAPRQGVFSMIVIFFLWVLASVFYTFLVQFHQIDTVPGYLCVASLLWVAFAMPPTIMGSFYTGYPFQAVAVDSAYQLAGYYLLAGAHIFMRAPVL